MIRGKVSVYLPTKQSKFVTCQRSQNYNDRLKDSKPSVPLGCYTANTAIAITLSSEKSGYNLVESWATHQKQHTHVFGKTLELEN